MRYFRRRSELKKSVQHISTSALENAWKIHQAQGEWTNRVDTKAAFAFTIQSAVIATAIALIPKVETLHGWNVVIVFYVLGILFLLVGSVLAALVVVPRLRRRQTVDESANNFIYFGHARLWNPEDLRKEIERIDLLPQLTRQIVVMSKILWIKHNYVKWSFICTFLGLYFFVFASLLLILHFNDHEVPKIHNRL